MVRSAKRQPRQSRDELRAVLIETGRAILRDEGMGTGAETLTFKRVFERVYQDRGLRLTNASVIKRVWANQAEFQTDVLVAIAADEGVVEFDRAVEALAPVYEAMGTATPTARWAVLREVCRVGGAAHMAALTESADWPLWIGVWTLSSAGDPSEQGKRIDDALLSGYGSLTSRFDQAFEGLTARLGLRLRAPLTVRQLTMAVGALAEGCALRGRVDPTGMYGIVRHTGPHGEDQEWTLFGIGLEALAHQFFEMDPDAGDLSAAGRPPPPPAG
jgi:hypothetical protein